MEWYDDEKDEVKYMEENKTCFGKFDKDNCECIICNVVVECYESKLGADARTSQH